MSSDQWTARLSEYIDGELAPTEHATLERHLSECDECRETVTQLRRVRSRAGVLEDRPPLVDLWPGIAERIGVQAGAGQVSARRRRWMFSMPQLAAAGMALFLAGAGGMWMVLGGNAGDATSRAAAAAPAVSAAPESGQRFAGLIGYDAAVADLERVLAENRGLMDSTLVQILEESLMIIDRAIARAQDALAGDPGDAYLNNHLAATMRRKLALLRQAAEIATASL